MKCSASLGNIRQRERDDVIKQRVLSIDASEPFDNFIFESQIERSRRSLLSMSPSPSLVYGDHNELAEKSRCEMQSSWKAEATPSNVLPRFLNLTEKNVDKLFKVAVK